MKEILKNMGNLGIDLGRTLKQGADAAHAPFPLAFETVKKFHSIFDNIYIVSRVNPEQRERALKWFETVDFFNLTGIKPENVYFCFDRRDKHLFAKGLDITCFIDDRPDCLIPMGKEVLKILFNPFAMDLAKEKDKLEKLKNLHIVKNWGEIAEYFEV